PVQRRPSQPEPLAGVADASVSALDSGDEGRVAVGVAGTEKQAETGAGGDLAFHAPPPARVRAATRAQRQAARKPRQRRETVGGTPYSAIVSRIMLCPADPSSAHEVRLLLLPIPASTVDVQSIREVLMELAHHFPRRSAGGVPSAEMVSDRVPIVPTS